MESQWTVDPVWIHGDLESSNILISDDQLVAVIDFGNCAVGDPACDLVMAWTFFDKDIRTKFRSAIEVDVDTWHRARAWALWKGLFRMSRSIQSKNKEFDDAKRLVEDILTISI